MKLKRIISLTFVLIMLTTLFSGCDQKDMALYNAFNKSQDIKCMESTTDLSISFSASGYPETEKESIEDLVALIDGSKIKLDQKFKRNEDNTRTKVQMDASANVADITYDFSFWLDIGMTKDTPVVKEIFKLPEMFMLQFPSEMKGKEYLVYDINEILSYANEVEMNFDYSKMYEYVSKYQTKFIEAFSKYAKEFDPGCTLVTRKENKVVDGQRCSIYEIKLDDKSFKKLIKYSINDILKDEDLIKLFQDYLLGLVEVMSNNQEEVDAMKAEVNMIFTNKDKYILEIIDGFNKFIKAFENVQIVGDDGIVIEYAVNMEGYIINEKGILDFVIDTKSIANAVGSLVGEEIQSEDLNSLGIYEITFNTETKNTEINGNVDIVMPKLTEENSISLFDMIMGVYDTSSYNTYVEVEVEEEEVVDDNILVIVNEEIIISNVDPQIIEGNTMVSARSISEALGAQVKWDGEKNEITITKDDTIILLTINSTNAVVNGNTVALNVPVMNIGGSTMVPVEFICDNLNAEIAWDEELQLLIISSK